MELAPTPPKRIKMSEKKSSDATTETVTDEEIVTSPDGGRRGVLQVLSVAAIGTAAKALTGCVVAQPQPTVYTQPQGTTVVATGAPPPVVVAQPQAGYATGLTDSDSGNFADPAGNGRGPRRGMQTGLTDSDSGAYADAVGQGRGVRGRASGLTDSDGGAYADPVGNGRGTARLGNTGLTDSDGGPYADAVGHGRGRWR